MHTIYLGCPYTGTEQERIDRYEQVTKYANKLMQSGCRVFSPITHSHPIYESDNSISNDQEFWMNQDLYWMNFCDALYILCLDGWEESEGLLSEVKYARLIGIQVVYIRWF